MADKNRNEWEYTLKLKRNVPAHAKVMEILEDYQRQTGLSKKDSLVMIILAYGSSIENHMAPLGTYLSVNKRTENDMVSDERHDNNVRKNVTKEDNAPAKESIMDEVLDISGVEALITSNYDDV